MNKDKATILSNGQQEAVKRYLEERFGTYGVYSHKLAYLEDSMMTYKASFEQELSSSALGIFSHALTKCFIIAQVWISDINDPLVTICSRYNHVGGGSNGCKINVSFYIRRDCRIFEVYEK